MLKHYNVGKDILMSFLVLEAAAGTNVGYVRSVNEDHLAYVIPQDSQVLAKKGALFVVADGLGGYSRGEVASELAVNIVRDMYYQNEREDNEIALKEAIIDANAAIYKNNEEQSRGNSEESSKPRSMATTCVAIVIRDHTLYVANVGDSLAYLIRGSEMRQIAENHSWVAEQLRNKAITKEEALAQGNGNILTRCLGEKDTVDVYTGLMQLQVGDILIICTDGLYNLVSEEEIFNLATQYGSEESVQRLIDLANKNGGPDNITIIAIHTSYAKK